MNRKVAFSTMRGSFRIPLMVGVVFATFAVYLLVAGAVFALKGAL